METDSNTPIQDQLRQLFDAAAVKSIAVLNQDDAETEMVRFLNTVKAHPDQRSFVVRLFTESFGDDYYLIRAPWQFMQFCMYHLRWPEIRAFVNAKREEDVNQRGARSSPVWNAILEAFEDNWAGAKEFKTFNNHSSSVAHVFMPSAPQ